MHVDAEEIKALSLHMLPTQYCGSNMDASMVSVLMVQSVVSVLEVQLVVSWMVSGFSINNTVVLVSMVWLVV